jgi:hypothetical protein
MGANDAIATRKRLNIRPTDVTAQVNWDGKIMRKAANTDGWDSASQPTTPATARMPVFSLDNSELGVENGSLLTVPTAIEAERRWPFSSSPPVRISQAGPPMSA